MSRNIFLIGLVIIASALLAGTVLVRAQSQPDAVEVAPGGTLTYQGQLQDGGAPANGVYDLAFRLFDAPAGGGQVDTAVAVEDVTVREGLFVVPLDFGAVPEETSLYLEVAVRPGDEDGDYATLTPRQALNVASETTAETEPSVPPASMRSAAAQSITRTHYVNPGAFNWDSDQTDIVMSTEIGLVWKPDVNEDAGFYMHRPPDWDGLTPVQVHIFFALGGSEAGTVNWRLKLNSYAPNSGQWLTNPGARDADEILVFASGPSWYRIYSQTFTLEPADFQDESLWEFYFLRGNGANGETFTGNLYVLGAEVAYQAGY